MEAPAPETVQPWDWSAATRFTGSPTNVTRMVDVPPTAGFVVSAEVTPGTRLTDTSAC